MTKRLYVDNLPSDMTETALRDLFAQTGEVTRVTLIAGGGASQSGSLAFVEMANDAATREAIGQLNGKAMGGRMLIVAEAGLSVMRWTTDGNGGSYNRGYRNGRSGYGASHAH